MRINAVTQPFQAELRKAENAKKSEKSSVSSRSQPVDRPEISADARQLSSTRASIEVLSASLIAQGDIRTDKIAEVKQKIESGFYDSPEFIDRLAEKLLAEFGIKEA